MIWVWFSISDRLSKLTERDRKVYGLVEAVLLKREVDGSKGIAEVFETEKSKRNSIQQLRRYIAISITLLWLAIFILTLLRM